MTLAHDLIETQLASFGSRLRELRQSRTWSLQEVADRSQLSKTFLSRLESGDRQASIAAVLTLAQVFSVSLASLFEEPEIAVEPCLIVRASQAVMKTANGLTYSPLSNAERFINLQPLRVIIPLTRQGNTHYQHAGEEWIYVLSGKITLSLAGKAYDLEVGDAVHFDSQLPHRLIARGSREAEVLLVATPFSEEGRASLSPMQSRRAIPAPISLPSRSVRKSLPEKQK
jgi:transcriptional regulator with XRE-family HTH domain